MIVPDLTAEELARFCVACQRQDSEPRTVVADLIRDYTELHAPKPYDQENDPPLAVLQGGAS